MIVNCFYCGKEIESKKNIKRVCNECKRINKNKWERDYYSKHEEHYREYAKQNRLKNKNKPISPKRAEYLKRDSWAAKKIAKELPQFCTICKNTSHLQAHRKIKDGEYTIDNVVMLCPKCHKRVHSGVETID